MPRCGPDDRRRRSPSRRRRQARRSRSGRRRRRCRTGTVSTPSNSSTPKSIRYGLCATRSTWSASTVCRAGHGYHGPWCPGDDEECVAYVLVGGGGLDRDRPRPRRPPSATRRCGVPWTSASTTSPSATSVCVCTASRCGRRGRPSSEPYSTVIPPCGRASPWWVCDGMHPKPWTGSSTASSSTISTSSSTRARWRTRTRFETAW